MNFPVDYFKQTLCEILAIDSPSGYTGLVVAKLKACVDEMGYENYLTAKGNLVVNVPGQTAHPPRSIKTIGISAHVDTLGLVVRGFRHDGTLSFSQVGGAILPTLDGEYCNIYTRWGKKYTGTILSNSPSSHVYDDAGSAARNDKGMHVKLDEEVKCADDAKKLGILAGDFICYAPKTEFTASGFIKSRFLDDKMSVAIILCALKYFKDEGIAPAHNICAIFSTYEEVGHGLSHLPQSVDEFVTLDMGCIGDDLTCTEYDVSICAKDSSGPYDYELTTRLITLAKEAGLGFAVDIYPRYGSDVSAARAAGHDIKGALIGPGVAASHGMERSHMKAAENTWKLLHLYLTNK
jgi:putative aminopeptidase FrvX